MSVQQRQSISTPNVVSNPANDTDLESTAELPVLDVAAFEAARADEKTGSTDTWVIPASVLSTDPALKAPAPADEHRSQLEVDLRSLSESLRDVEERLSRKGERLLELERELASTRAERAAANERVAALGNELTQVRNSLSVAEARSLELHHAIEEHKSAERTRDLREQEVELRIATRERAVLIAQHDVREIEARATSYFESLSSLEGRRVIFESELGGLDDQVAEREARIAELQQQLGERTVSARDLTADVQNRVKRIASLERENNALAAALAQRDEQLDRAERAKEELAQSVKGMAASLAAREERISALESAANQTTRSVSEQQREFERVTAERAALNSQVATLEMALASANARIAEHETAALAAAAGRTQVDGELETARSRIEQLEREAEATRTHSEALAANATRAEAERTESVARQTAAERRTSELEAQVADHAETIALLQEELRASANRHKELEGDLHAAEDTLHRIEAELRLKTGRVEELTKTNEEWRSLVQEARSSMVERESLIQRLEAEAAHSAMLLGNIQQSIRRLDPAATSGSHHEIAPEGAVRLMIRADGDTEVVHVLGRKTTVGRTPDNDLQIDAKFISRHHAVILAGPTHTIIEDLHSTNGVLVNGRRITRQTLKDGDSVHIGKTQLRFALRPTGGERR